MMRVAEKGVKFREREENLMGPPCLTLTCIAAKRSLASFQRIERTESVERRLGGQSSCLRSNVLATLPAALRSQLGPKAELLISHSSTR